MPILRIAFLAATVLLAASKLFPQASPTPPDDAAAQDRKFTALLGAIEQNYVDPIDPDHLIFDGGVRGMLSTLDPFCAFLDRDQFELLKQQTRGEALGFGSILYLTPGKILILQTTPGSPSGRAGLGPGDEIVEINRQRVDRLEFQELIDLLQRSRSHPVRLGVIHPGRVISQDFDLNPAAVAVPSVDKAFLWAPGIAYVHVSSFEGKTTQEVDEALNRQDAAHLKGLLLDLRDNHGGIVDAAVGVASLFLKPNQLVLTTRGRHMPAKTYLTAELPHYYGMPIVVLVNGETASAAEVLAAALQEHDRAIVAGEPTYGKGVVQSVMQLSEDTGMALTAGQYFTPSGRSVQRPLPGTALTFATLDRSAEPQKADETVAGSPPTPPAAPTFQTDGGRPVLAGGGINPDVTIRKNAMDPWLTFVTQRGYLTSYAEGYITTHGKIGESFEPPPDMLEDFRTSLERNGVRVPEPYWRTDQDFLKLHLKVEITNLVFGLARGDEVETKGDPQAQEAATLFPRISQILQKH